MIKPAKKVCMIDDDRGPIDLYEQALRMRFGDDQVERFTTLVEAMRHAEAVQNKEETAHQIYLIDIMMPPIKEEWFKVTNEGLTSGLFFLKRLREAGSVSAKILLMTSVSNPEILQLVGETEKVGILAKIEWLPSEFAAKVEEVLQA